MRFNSSKLSVAAATVLAAASFSQATLSVNFRFADGSASKDFAPGDTTPVAIQAWVTVTGTAGNTAEEGLQSAIFATKSYVSVGAGFAGSIGSAQLATGWNGSGSFGGLSNNISNDGIGDWGNANNTPLSLTANVFRPRTTKSINNAVDWGDSDSPAGSVHNSLVDGGEEFLVGIFNWTPTNTAPGGTVVYAPVMPLGGTVAVAGWYLDTSDKTAGAPTGSQLPSNGGFGPQTPNTAAVNGVTMNYIPEPASVSLLGVAGLMFMRRNRKA